MGWLWGSSSVRGLNGSVRACCPVDVLVMVGVTVLRKNYGTSVRACMAEAMVVWLLLMGCCIVAGVIRDIVCSRSWQR